MVKDKMNGVISNPKLSMLSSKISPDTIDGFTMSTIDNEYTRSVLIL